MFHWFCCSAENQLRFDYSQGLGLVCHCYRDEGNVIRIISARKASAHESKQYR
ncbi:MAG: BrnT family toxin [Betaproteobacteria bacterium]|nr:BrnT family toxin [Betaproteobacteria bacterium]